MLFEELPLAGAFVITPKRFEDGRGFFSETYSQRDFDRILPDTAFVQDNHSLSRDAGVLRGLHFQKPPFEQGKLVRVTAGKVLDVIVDIRAGSPTFAQHISVELSAENGKQLWVPPGFAHAFITLEPNTEFLYKVTSFYAPEHDAGIAYNDPELDIQWPFDAGDIILSDKDRALPFLRDIETPFTYQAPNTKGRR